MNDMDHMKDFHELLLSEFHMVAPEKIDHFVEQFSVYIDAKVSHMVGTVHGDALQRVHDRLQAPERGDPIHHGAIANSPEHKRRHGTMKTFAEFNAAQ